MFDTIPLVISTRPMNLNGLVLQGTIPQTTTLKVGEFRIVNFTSAFDEEGDEVVISIETKDKRGMRDCFSLEGEYFMVFPMSLEDQGEYEFIVTLKDINFYPEQLSNSYDFKVVIEGSILEETDSSSPANNSSNLAEVLLG